LRLSQLDFGKLLGTTAHSVYLWEKKEGALKLRDKTRQALLSIKGLRAGEARAKLDEAGGKRKSGRLFASNRRKKIMRSGVVVPWPVKISASEKIVTTLWFGCIW